VPPPLPRPARASRSPCCTPSQPGIHCTKNDGPKWTRAAAKGLGGDLKSLVVHPSDAGILAAGTADGLYLSRNSGETFERLALFAGAKPQALPIPALAADAVA
jgi:hypothetical protein